MLSHCNSTNVDQVSAQFSHSDWRTALHIAAFLGNVVILQLLLWVSLSTACVIFYALATRHCQLRHYVCRLSRLFVQSDIVSVMSCEQF